MTHTFQLQEAKNRFSEVIDLCLREGPQIVTRHGKPVVQIVPFDARQFAPASSNFAAYLLSAPREAALPTMKRRNRKAAPQLG
jgi:antitoxin Phd